MKLCRKCWNDINRRCDYCGLLQADGSRLGWLDQPKIGAMTYRKHGCNNTRPVSPTGYWTQSFKPQYVEDRGTEGCHWQIENPTSSGCVGCREKSEATK